MKCPKCEKEDVVFYKIVNYEKIYKCTDCKTEFTVSDLRKKEEVESEQQQTKE